MQNAQALTILKSVFGYDAFRGVQADVVSHVIEGGDALVLMPTGGGKSMCYQVPALVRAGTAVIISPLIALMQNQVSAMKVAGVKAAFLNSTLTAAEARAVEDDVRSGHCDLLYMAPERLLLPQTLQLLKAIPLALFAVDEAHCISQWGHDFRKDYLQLGPLRDAFPDSPWVALTATADQRTREEIVSKLRLKNSRTFLSSFNRPNITYSIGLKNSPKDQLLNFLDTQGKDAAGIVYCLSRNSVEKTAEVLQKAGYQALPYHAGLSVDTRAQNLDRFLKDDAIVMVATIAFGMGIDKPDVRFVAHMDLPRNLEAYYQETGRAGRDGEAAVAWMVYGMQDVVTLRQWVDQSEGDEAFKKLARQKMNALLAFCESSTCRRQQLLAYFDEAFPAGCAHCDNCLEPPATWDATIAAQKALSCIFRTGQKFGVGHLVDVLRGEKTERVKQLGHDQVSTFGIGLDFTPQIWTSLYRQLLAKNYVTADSYGALQLAPEATPLLRHSETLLLRQESLKATGKRPKKTGRATHRAGTDATLAAAPVASALRDNLGALRLKLAKEAGLPAYCIFHNATLDALAIEKPQSLEAMRNIPGVGAAKLAKYGPEFLIVLQSGDPSC